MYACMYVCIRPELVTRTRRVFQTFPEQNFSTTDRMMVHKEEDEKEEGERGKGEGVIST